MPVVFLFDADKNIIDAKLGRLFLDPMHKLCSTSRASGCNSDDADDSKNLFSNFYFMHFSISTVQKFCLRDGAKWDENFE